MTQLARILAIAALVAALPALTAPSAALAQGVGLTPKSDKPIVIESEDGVEWRKKEQIYLAKGNATATRGDTKIRADLLKAHYRQEKGKRGNQIWKVEAIGNVKITSPKETIYGQKGVYIAETAVFTLTGNNLKLVTEKQTITARDKIAYDTRKKRADVVGNALAVEKDKRISAGRFVAWFEDDKDGKTKMTRVDALGGVTIVTKSEVLRGDRATYTAKTRIAMLIGNVKVTKGDNQLNCDRAEVNLETGISKMSGKCRVIIHPREGEGKGPLDNISGGAKNKSN
jgi:lipopolysaccharide export system protein LptA